MAVAHFMVHAQKSFFPLLDGGDATILYCFNSPAGFRVVTKNGGVQIEIDNGRGGWELELAGIS
jgi:hypothetical protein